MVPNNPLNQENYKEYAHSLRKTADENNIIFNQSHAPFPSYIQFPNEDQIKIGYNEIIVHYIVRAMEVTSILGGKIMIVHPITLLNHTYKDQKEFNINFFNNLLPYCKKFNVKIALENMWIWDEKTKKVLPGVCAGADEFVDYLDSLDKNYFVACLDIGHSEMLCKDNSLTVEMINALGHDKLKSLHVHDNDKIHDSHTLPFTQKINWDEIMQALKNINYDGDFIFEADHFISKFPDELYVNASALMLDVGRYFINKYDL
jgi:sugar phosphate isomerase/epimerase